MHRIQIEKLKAENVQSKQGHENAVKEGQMHQQSIYKKEVEINSSREQIKMLHDQVGKQHLKSLQSPPFNLCVNKIVYMDYIVYIIMT